MKKYIIGEKFKDKKFDFRETCFGICEQDGKILLTKKLKNNEISLIGGGIEDNESKEECLKREFLEESGYIVKDIKNLCTIDCFWLADGKWPMESLANIFIVEVLKNNIEPTEKGHVPLWISIEDCTKTLLLPYQIEAIKKYINYKNKHLKHKSF